MPTPPEHAERLFRLSQEAADEQGKTLTDIAREADVSPQAVYKWRKGKSVRAKTDRAISRAFGWEAGSREAILAGGAPTPLQGEHRPPAPPPRVFDDSREQAIWDLEVLSEAERLHLITALRQRDQLLGEVRGDDQGLGSGAAG
ncbi:helix-turn-helix transcriptional regulator [Nocardiopsis sp. CNT-189]|uniref:helix-turn-helix domain-containing protein n=1 Tax=Nocardiopsis oceanisediminis TaxID=2816862 RepID=UPI003B2C2B37